MKYIQILLISLLLPGSLPGQEIALLSDTIQVPFKLHAQKEKNVFPWSPTPEKDPLRMVKTSDLQLLPNGDLQIDLDLIRLQKWENAFHYRHTLQLQTQDERLQTPTNADFGARNQASTGGNQQLTWHGALENTLEFGRQDCLLVITEIWGDPTALPLKTPNFDVRKKWPHYTGLAVGAGLLITGQLYKRDADQTYRQYEDIWTQQAKITNEGGKPESEAAPYYSESEDQYNLHKNLTYAGIAIIGIDAIWYAFRHAKYKKHKKLYDKYGRSAMEQPITLQPAYQLSSQPGGIAYAGLRLQISF